MGKYKRREFKQRTCKCCGHEKHCNCFKRTLTLRGPKYASNCNWCSGMIGRVVSDEKRYKEWEALTL